MGGAKNKTVMLPPERLEWSHCLPVLCKLWLTPDVSWKNNSLQRWFLFLFICTYFLFSMFLFCSQGVDQPAEEKLSRSRTGNTLPSKHLAFFGKRWASLVSENDQIWKKDFQKVPHFCLKDIKMRVRRNDWLLALSYKKNKGFTLRGSRQRWELIWAAVRHGALWNRKSRSRRPCKLKQSYTLSWKDPGMGGGTLSQRSCTVLPRRRIKALELCASEGTKDNHTRLKKRLYTWLLAANTWQRQSGQR